MPAPFLMNPLELGWAMMAAACLTLGLVHLYVWNRQRRQYGSLLFFALASSIAALAACELAMMDASTAQVYATALRWAHVPLAIAILCAVGFVYFYFGRGKAWLAYATCVVRLFALALNFVTGVNLNFTTITALDHIRLWGGAVVSVPIGVLNPSWIVGVIGNVLLVAFFADASLALWRRGDTVSRRRALFVGGGFILCVLFGFSLALLAFTGRLRAPTLVTPAFFLVVLAMGYELGESVVQAAQLSRDLRASERRTELATQAAGLAFWSWHAVSREFWLSPSAQALFGFTEHGPVDLHTFLTHVHPHDRYAVRLALEGTLADGAIFEQEFRISPTNSVTRWIATHGQADVNDSGVSLLVHGVALDITARVQMEREVVEHREELAHMSRVSTLGALAGSIAHEINQPLMGILGSAELAQSLLERARIDWPELSEALGDIVAEDKRARDVIRRLRGLLRRGHVLLQPLDMNAVVQDVLRLTHRELLHRGVGTKVSLAQGLPLLFGDRVQMQQVLLNLVMNACDAMNGSSAQLQICTQSGDADTVELSITDCGCGIPVTDLERIFEPFVTTKANGIGLGLSVSRRIVAAHGGQLWAENNPGPGATFRLSVPCDAAI